MEWKCIAQVHPLLDACCDVLNSSFTRDRFVAQCLRGGPGAAYEPLFNSFGAILVKWRFGCVTKVVRAMLKLETPLRRFWDLPNMRFQDDAGAAGGAGPTLPIVDDGGDGNPIGGQRLKGPNLVKANEAITSPEFWYWLHAFEHIADILGAIDSYFSTCTCHRGDAGQARLHTLQLQRSVRTPTAVTTCPLVGRLAPEVACGEFEGWISELLRISTVVIGTMDAAAGCAPRARAAVLDDFECARNHLVYSLRLHLSPWYKLPLKLCGMGHHNEDTAREAYRECLVQWAVLTDAEKTSAHALSRDMCTPGSPLFDELGRWLGGEAAQELPLVARRKVCFRLILLTEQSVEGRHRGMHQALMRASNSGPVQFSLEERFPEALAALEASPRLFQRWAAEVTGLCHPIRIAERLGLCGHPELADLENKHIISMRTRPPAFVSHAKVPLGQPHPDPSRMPKSP